MMIMKRLININQKEQNQEKQNLEIINIVLIKCKKIKNKNNNFKIIIDVKLQIELY